MVSGPVKIQGTIRFGEDCELDLRAFELRRAGRPVKLERIPMQVLLFLIEYRNELVTREQIAERIWGKDVFLDTDNSINGAIRKIRQALRDDPEEPRFVQTITGQGYRFIADVIESQNGPALAPSQSPSRDDHLSRSVSPVSEARNRNLRLLWLALGVTVVVGATFVVLQLARKRPLPFEVVKTVRLTSAGHSAKAIISPDGSYIAHTLRESGQESLRVRQAKMVNDLEIVPPQPVVYLGITFSPDSQAIYYVAQRAGNEPGALYRIPVIGGTPQKLKDGIDSPITFSPDGKKFAFVRESAVASTLMIADLDGAHEQLLVARKLPEVLDYPGWSPDGRVIAFTDTDAAIASPKGSNATIVEVRVGDRSEASISRQAWGFVRELAWLHDQRGLVISARSPEESGFFHIWYLSYPDGTAREVTEGLYRQRGVSISADSRKIVTVQESAFSSVWRAASIRVPNPELVVSGESGTSAPMWTPQGSLVFEEELDGRRSIWGVNVDGTNRRELTLTGNNYDYSISGDGRKLAFVSDRSGVPAIWTMDIESGNSLMVTKATGEPVPQLSPDAKWIAFTAIGAGHWTTLWRIPANGGKAVEINDKLWMRPAISPDGKWIAGFYADGQLNTQTNPTSIAVISSDGGPLSKVIRIPLSVLVSGGIRWSPDGRGLSYINRAADGANIWNQPLTGGAAYEMTRFQGFDLFSFDWSSDGKQLVFSRGIQARDVVLIEDETQN